MSYINVITYFHEIIRIHMSVETYTYHLDNSPYGTLMDGWRKTEDRIVKSQSRVISECYVQASRQGPVPPPQGPGGRCRGTDGQGPSSSDA